MGRRPKDERSSDRTPGKRKQTSSRKVRIRLTGGFRYEKLEGDRCGENKSATEATEGPLR